MLLSTQLITDVVTFELDDYCIRGVSFNTPGNNALRFRLSIIAEVSISGKSKYEYESNSKSIRLSVYCESILKNSLCIMSKLFGWKNTIKTALTKKVLWITISFLIFTVKMLILLQRIFCINIATEH